MDNVTHSLAGLVLAESAARLRARRTGAEPSAGSRAAAAIAAMVAAYLPVGYLFYSGTWSDQLTYMLQLRGFSQTVVVEFAGA